MKNNRSITARALSTILIGALVLAFPQTGTTYLVMAIGALFLIPGLISIISYFWKRRASQNNNEQKQGVSKFFPIIGLGSILFGVILLLFPNNFESALLYILGAFIILASLSQMLNFIRLGKFCKIGAIPYILSLLLLAAGVVVIIMNYNALPAEAANPNTEGTQNNIPSIIFGVASVIYGISELVYAINFRNTSTSEPVPTQPQITDKVEDAEVIDEN